MINLPEERDTWETNETLGLDEGISKGSRISMSACNQLFNLPMDSKFEQA